jgi:hypothetical protein
VVSYEYVTQDGSTASSDQYWEDEQSRAIREEYRSAVNWYPQALAAQAIQQQQWAAYMQRQQWIMANGSTITFCDAKPEPIDPDLLMDEGL